MTDLELISLLAQSLAQRVRSLLSLTQFGRIHPTFGVKVRERKYDGSLPCHCGGQARNGKPCKAGKHPILGRWQNIASKDPKAIRAWAKSYSTANWGIATGEDIDVLDFDGQEGLAELGEIEARFGRLTGAFVVKTGNGLQYYFRHDLQHRIPTARGVRPGVDARGSHEDGKSSGYVMAPGSVHPNGTVYRIVQMPVEWTSCPNPVILHLWNQSLAGKVTISTSQVGRRREVSRRREEGRGEESRVGKEGANLAPSGKCQSWSGPGSLLGPVEFQVTTSIGVLQTILMRVNENARLTPERQARMKFLRSLNGKFNATWLRDRGPGSKWPFKNARNSDSEYEGSIAFYLRGDGWTAQEIMDAIVEWHVRMVLGRLLKQDHVVRTARTYDISSLGKSLLPKLKSKEPAQTKVHLKGPFYEELSERDDYEYSHAPSDRAGMPELVSCPRSVRHLYPGPGRPVEDLQAPQWNTPITAPPIEKAA